MAGNYWIELSHFFHKIIIFKRINHKQKKSLVSRFWSNVFESSLENERAEDDEMKSKQERCEHMVISHKYTHTRFAKANQSRNPNGSSSDASSLLAMFGKIFVRLSNERLTLVVFVWAQMSSSIANFALLLNVNISAVISKYISQLERVTFLFSCHQTTSLNPINFIAGWVHLLSLSFSSFRRSLVHQQWSSIRLPPLISWLFMSNDETIVQPVFMIVTSRFINLTIE